MYYDYYICRYVCGAPQRPCSVRPAYWLATGSRLHSRLSSIISMMMTMISIMIILISITITITITSTIYYV